jgi:uncharacterized protein (TIGR02453 family)
MPTSPNLDAVLRFLDELSQNNNKPWFEAHRPAYESARAAFEQFVDGLIDEFRGPDNLQGLSARNCIARIHRDIRFSKDKSPYKTNLGAMIAPGGWKTTALGYYIHLEPGARSMVAGGLYNPTAEQLQRFRQAIDAHAGRFKEVTGAQAFVRTFGNLAGERLKTAPKGFDRSHPEIALLQLKQITAIHHFSDQEVLAPDFADQVASACRAMKPFLETLEGILQ